MILWVLIVIVDLQVETMSDEEREERELDLTSPEVVTKYKSAAEIVNSQIFFPYFVCRHLILRLLVYLCVYRYVCLKFVVENFVFKLTCFSNIESFLVLVLQLGDLGFVFQLNFCELI